MKRIASLSVALTLLSLHASAQSASVPRKLPAATAAFVHLDLPVLLGEGEATVTAVDPQLGKSIVGDLKKLWGKLREFAATQEFNPQLFAAINQCQAYLVLLELPEEMTVTSTMMVPKYPENPEDWENFDPAKAEMVEEEFSEKHTHCLSLVVETPSPDVAKDFFTQLRGLLQRRKEKDPENNRYELVAVTVDNGEMFKEKNSPATVGWIGSYLVVSDLMPAQLWHHLAAPGSDNPLADSELMQRYAAGSMKKFASAVANLDQLIKLADKSLARNLEEARGAGGAAAGDTEDYTLQSAQRARESFLALKRILGLDKMLWAGLAAHSQNTGGQIDFLTRGTLTFRDEDLPPVLRNLLDGGAQFSPPPFLDGNAVTFMLRSGPSEILAGILAGLPPVAAGGYQMASGMMKMQVGAGPEEMAAAFAGDLYISMDLVPGTRSIPDGFDEDNGEVKFRQVESALPRFTVLFGMSDKERFAGLFTAVVSRLTAAGVPTAEMIKKEVYQGSEVYLVGTPMMGMAAMMGGEAQANPDDPNAIGRYAFACAGRYLCIGKWDDVTRVLRQAANPAADSSARLRELAEKHRGANLLVWAPPEFNQRVQKMQATNSEQGLDFLNQMLEDMFSGEEGPGGELGTEIAELLKSLIANVVTLNKNFIAGVQQGQITVGKLAGRVYEIRQEGRILTP